MKRYWTIAFQLAGAAACLIAAILVAGIAAPFVGESLRSIGAEFRSAGGDSGLIYVESPEVYTRQRLVNDRYLQDAWLRQKLVEIDAEGQTWIDTVQLVEDAAQVSIGETAGGQDATGAALPDIATPLSFERKFDLQSNARDTIRQMILENALDDRHDLSGNTVFGLKFDTSVLPGSRTTLNPTVIVRMEANPLERLTMAAEDLAPYFNASTWSGADSLDGGDVDLLRNNDRYFDAWRNNLEERLNRQRSIETSTRECRQPEMLDAMLCDSTYSLTDAGAATLDTLLSQSAAVDEALEFVLRIPERDLSIERDLKERTRAAAQAYCERRNRPGTVRDFLAGRGAVFPLPAPWGDLLEINVNLLPPEGESICSLDLDIDLNPLNVVLLFVPANRADAALRMGLAFVPCNAPACSPDTLGIWIQDSHAESANRVLDNETIEGLILDGAAISDGSQLCFGENYYFERDRSVMPGENFACGRGVIANFRMGAYQFLRRMTEVESYTYATFPRGDVSGVVTETGSSRGVGAAVDTPFGRGSLGLDRQDRQRSVAASPGVINFASGDRLEDFDFGWSIVKEGYKSPMVASQIVLVSVPAYLDEIRLEIIKGFLDLDAVPADFSERRQNADPGESLTDEERAARLRERVDTLFTSWEPRTIHLKLPPDYRALDSVVIGNSVTAGPRINSASLPCYRAVPGFPLTLAIPGERLWRSTVVTLDGRKATQIEVMPNMEGLLATFDQFESDATRSSVTRELSVWTSEGTDSEDVDMCGTPPG